MNIKEFREVTLGELERLTGVDRPRWSRYLSGKTSVTVKTLEKAAPKLGMTTDELLKAMNERAKSVS
ncbi:MAG: helix-turn-helix transcriptional regulator [Crinalium sp.]